MASDTSARLVQATRQLIATQGSHRTSFSDVLAASKGPRGSLYHHFPGGKEELIAAALAETGASVREALEATRGTSALEVTNAFLDMWRQLLVRTDFVVGCAVTGVTVDAESDTLVASAGTVFREWGETLASLLVDGGVPSTAAPGLATHLIASAEGAVVIARARRDMLPFEQVATYLQQTVSLATAQQ